ncbi:MAG: family 43 glycosylhydrolase [Lachnospiraceae bacterium]|nr:family 43 glycosylhydrolase [Lachnospiraceae bacterium]
MSALIYVYTKPVDADCYPEGLANSIHIACETNSRGKHPFNRDYGILFAEGDVSADHTIIPKGIKTPCIFQMDDDTIGIAGTRILEHGEPDETCPDQVLLWTTKDLIHFSKERLTDKNEILQWTPSDRLAIDDRIAGNALLYWEPIRCTGITVPKNVHVHSENELDRICATVTYSDGSERQKKVDWNRSGISFDKQGTCDITGHINQQCFRFPLAKGYGDPVLFPWEGKWYFIATSDNRNDIGLYVREADNPEGLFAEGAEEHLILPFDPERGFEQTFWAPEFHVIGGELYILFAVSGHTWGPQCHMMKKKQAGRITDEDAWEDPVRVLKMDGTPLAEDAITLDMTYIKAESGSYVTWSYRENIGTPADSGSMLYIASVDDNRPWQLTSDPMLLTRPLYGWENVSGTINNEGPHAFVRDGMVYVTYSGGAANGYTYALGLLTAKADADLLNLHSWEKSVTPVLTFYSVKGEYGPGHNSFFTNSDGELMIAYHAETDITEHLRCDGIRRVHFRADGSPYFQMSADEDIRSATVKMTVSIG